MLVLDVFLYYVIIVPFFLYNVYVTCLGYIAICICLNAIITNLISSLKFLTIFKTSNFKTSLSSKAALS